MKKSTPLVSVLVPVYNSEDYLDQLLDSVNRLYYDNYELIFVDDQSTDNSVKILETAANEDDRIKIYRNSTNLGPSATLNKAVNYAKGDLLARLDSDDLMVPGRLVQQVYHIQENPNIGLLGTAYWQVDAEGNRFNSVKPRILDGDGLRAQFLFNNAMGHSTVMYTRRVFEKSGGYDESLRASLDYDLLSRLSIIAECAVLPQRLVEYRTHGSNITTKLSNTQIQNAARVQRNLLDHYGFTPTEEDFKHHLQLGIKQRLPENRIDQITLLNIRNWLRKIEIQNDQLKAFDEASFSRLLAQLHTSIYARSNSGLRLRDYVGNFTTEFSSLSPRNLLTQIAHSAKNGL